MKRLVSSSSTDSTAAKRRKVSQKWNIELDKKCHTLSWHETSGVGMNKMVERLKCKVCIEFQSAIEGRHNFCSKVLIPATLKIIHILTSTLML
jgi:hypothetical protein